ncbi:hypothetical protein R3J32_04395 [Xylella fastidiosa subsp. multiplex]
MYLTTDTANAARIAKYYGKRLTASADCWFVWKAPTGRMVRMRRACRR